MQFSILLIKNKKNKNMPDLSLPKVNLNISTPAPIIGSNGVVYKPGQFTTLKNPGLANPYLQKPTGKTDTSLKKPSEMKLDRPKTDLSEPAPENKSVDMKNIYIVAGAIFVIGALILINQNSEK